MADTKTTDGMTGLAEVSVLRLSVAVTELVVPVSSGRERTSGT